MDLETGLHEYYQAWSCQDADAVVGFSNESSTFEDLAFAAKFVALKQIRSFVESLRGSRDFHDQFC